MSGNQFEIDNAIGYMMIISKARFTTIYRFRAGKPMVLTMG